MEGQVGAAAPVAEAAGPADVPGRSPAGGILLRLGGCRYAVGMDEVAEVVALPAMTRVPGTPAWLAGVANWRGRMLPVLDVRSLLGAATTPLATSARLLVVQDGEVTAGLVAEAVPGVYDVPLDNLDQAPPTLSVEATRLVRGQVADPLGPIGVLDVQALLGLRDQLDRRRHGS